MTQFGEPHVIEVIQDGPAGNAGPQGEQGPAGGQGPMGPAGLGAGVVLEYQFASPATTWQLQHNLNTYGLAVECFDMQDNPYEATIRYVSPDLIEVDWYYPMSGLARVFS